MDVSALKTGIYNQYKANPALISALIGGLHWLKGQQNPTYPYATYFIVSNHPELTFTEILEDSLIQFSIFHRAQDNPRDSSILDDVFTKLTACFDMADLTIAGYSHIFMLRGPDHEFVNEDDTLQHTVDYRTMIEKSR